MFIVTGQNAPPTAGKQADAEKKTKTKTKKKKKEKKREKEKSNSLVELADIELVKVVMLKIIILGDVGKHRHSLFVMMESISIVIFSWLQERKAKT